MSNTGIPRISDPSGKPRFNRKPAGVYYYSRKKKRLKQFLIGLSTLFILFTLCFLGFLFAPIEPFESLRELWVTTAMTTLHHQYLATDLFSTAEIQKIMDKNKATNLGNSHPDDVKTKNTAQNTGIELIDVSQKNFKGYLLKIQNPARVKVAATRYLGQVGEKAEAIAKENGAVAVINGGVFEDPQGTGNGGQPLGILISNGKVLHKDPVSSFDIIGLNRDNVLVLGHYTLEQIKQMNIRDAVTFSPFLVVDGKPSITQGDGGWGIAPRTAIGQTEDGTILMLVIDGRQMGSLGATLKDVQDIMLQYGAYNVANLDGGASSVLYYRGKMINHPSSQYGERSIPSFFIVK
ncbi:exopolysaccharide biosynthesis protein [Desulfosporosinus acidiphilus SJ4]|uniref:Exopolysaccharide biosynthesis protein n=1 Tax=Desulfosporosinus acidiphilus (strain DSM 22704 / JCM 16185 / SJ4) TaxID=646529 RepID=I4D5S4_DESAJ|nr:phosphodiester glycosidase family protein [Desulfosporosinus acidiphilus]AFM41148.1 exopolysaccharide biosynthesis protein [Desulfosporosinus acidiphilus SJ4]